MTLQAVGTLSKGAGLAYIPYEPKQPEAREVLVESLFAGLEHIDIGQAASGAYIETFPFFLGKAWSGRVLKVGSGITDLQPGDAVLGVGYVQESAGYRPQLTARREHLAKLPAGFALQAASTIGHGFATAAFTLFHKAHVGLSLSPTPEEAKKPILIWGASTNVGTYGIQVLKSLGYSNILAVASAKHADHLKSIGATAVFDRGSPSIVQDLKTAAGEPVPYAAVFSIDEQGWSNLLQTLAPDARFSFIIRNGPPEDKIPSGVKYSRAVVLGLTDDQDIGQTAFPVLLQGLLNKGTLRAKEGELFEGPDLLETVKRAAKALAEAAGKDKIVIKVQ